MGRSLLIAFVLSATACSLWYDWDPNELPCRMPGGQCNDGYTCLAPLSSQPTCVRNGTRGADETCDQDAQCEDGLGCASDFVCRKPCDHFYSQSDCSSDEFCKDFVSRTDRTVKLGFCVTSECAPTQPCHGDPPTCVAIKASAYACMYGCTVSWDTSGYSDNCGSSTGKERYCQAVGRPSEQTLVCLDVGASGEVLGAACDPITRPCQRGLTCDARSQYKCVEFCDQTTANPNNCVQTGVSAICCNRITYGVCGATCE